jgi:hypothetical protein
VEHDALLLTGNTAWRYRSGGLLNSKLLVVLVNSFKLIKSVGSLLLALDACSRVLFGLLNSWVEGWALQITTLAAKEHAVKLRVDSRSLCHYAVELHQRVQVKLSQIT